MLADTPWPRGFGAALASVDTFFQGLQNSSLPPRSALQATCDGTHGLIEFLLSRQSFSAAFQVALRVVDHSPRTHLFSLSTPRIWIAWLLAQNLVSVLRRTGSADSAEHSRSSCAESPAARRRPGGRPSLARFRLSVAPSGGGSFRVGYDIDPLRVRRGLGLVVVVPVPPLVRLGLGVTVWRVLPGLLTAERRHIEVAPGGSHRFVAAAVDEVCEEHPLAVADECIVAVPLVDAEVHIEAVGDGVPGHLPAHPRLQARDVRLRRA